MSRRLFFLLRIFGWVLPPSSVCVNDAIREIRGVLVFPFYTSWQKGGDQFRCKRQAHTRRKPPSPPTPPRTMRFQWRAAAPAPAALGLHAHLGRLHPPPPAPPQTGAWGQ